MKTRPEHPELLLWHAARSLDPHQAAEVARHLAQCDECRLEVESLASLGRSVRLAGGTGHISVEELIAYEDGALAGDARRGTIERHLESCADCRDDRRALAGTRTTGSGARARPRRSRWAWASAAAAAAAVIVGVLVTARPSWLWHEAAPPIAFTPPRRGAVGERILTGGGPWRAMVLLPFDAPAGDYRVRIQRDDGADVDGAATTVRADRDLRLSVRIAPLAVPGLYRLIAAPEGLASPGSYAYPFRVDPAAPASPTESAP